MLYLVIPFYTNQRITAHNRTSHKKSSDDDYGGYSYRAAKTSLFYRVCFGCFDLLEVTLSLCRGPPYPTGFFKRKSVGIRQQKNI